MAPAASRRAAGIPGRSADDRAARCAAQITTATPRSLIYPDRNPGLPFLCRGQHKVDRLGSVANAACPRGRARTHPRAIPYVAVV